MKKAVRIMLVLIILILILLCTFWGLKKHISSQLAIDYMNKEEMCNVLKSNIEDFESVVQIFTNNRNHKEFYVKISKVSYDIPPFLNIFTYNQIKIEANEDFENKIKNSRAEYILKNMNFIMITATSDYICFVNRTGIGFSTQLVYSVTGEKPDILMFEETEHITGNWYYCY